MLYMYLEKTETASKIDPIWRMRQLIQQQVTRNKWKRSIDNGIGIIDTQEWLNWVPIPFHERFW